MPLSRSDHAYPGGMEAGVVMGARWRGWDNGGLGRYTIPLAPVHRRCHFLFPFNFIHLSGSITV